MDSFDGMGSSIDEEGCVCDNAGEADVEALFPLVIFSLIFGFGLGAIGAGVSVYLAMRG